MVPDRPGGARGACYETDVSGPLRRRFPLDGPGRHFAEGEANRGYDRTEAWGDVPHRPLREDGARWGTVVSARRNDT